MNTDNKYIYILPVLFILIFFIPVVVFGQYGPQQPYDPVTGGDLDVNDPSPDSVQVNTTPTPTESGKLGKNPSESGDTGLKNPIKYDSFAGLVYALLSSVISIGWIVVVFALIFVGFKFVTASGNPTKLDDAKRAFMWTIIGGVILLGSMGISAVICNTAQQFNTSLDCPFQ